MKQDRVNLENKLSIVLNEHNLNQEILDNVYNDMSKKGFEKPYLISIWNQIIPLETVDLPIMYNITKYLYKYAKEEIINPDKYFTEFETSEFDKFKMINNSKISYKNKTLDLSDTTQIMDDQWTTTLTFEQISEMFDLGLIKYNPDTQRDMKNKEVKGHLIQKININKKSVKEIEQLLLKNLFVSNTITLNIRKTSEEEISYNKNNKTIKIKGDIDIIDGFHRALAIFGAIKQNKSLKGSMIVSLTHFDKAKAQSYIVQEDKRNKISKEHIKYLNQENLENQVVKALNENTNSELRGLITTDIGLIKNNSALVLFSTLADSIKSQFNIKNQRDVRIISEYLIGFFNELTGIYYDEFSNILSSRKNNIITHSNTFIGYIALAGKLYNDDNWKNKLENILSKFNFDINNKWEDINIYETRPLKKDFNIIINYFIKEVE